MGPTVPTGRPTGSVIHMETPNPLPVLKRGQGFALVGLFAALCSMWVLPLGLGPIGMVLGGIAIARGESRGRWVIAIAAGCMVVGLILNLLPDSFVFSG